MLRLAAACWHASLSVHAGAADQHRGPSPGLPFPVTLDDPHVVPASQVQRRASSICCPALLVICFLGTRSGRLWCQRGGLQLYTLATGPLCQKHGVWFQVWAGVVPVGPCGVTLNSSYANRDSREYKEDLGCAQVTLKSVPSPVQTLAMS